MDTDTLYMALSEDKLEELKRPELKLMWEMNREIDCRDEFRDDEHNNFFPRNCCQQHWKFGNSIRGHLDFSKKNLELLRWLLFVLKLIAALMNRREQLSCVSKDLIKTR